MKQSTSLTGLGLAAPNAELMQRLKSCLLSRNIQLFSDFYSEIDDLYQLQFILDKQVTYLLS